MDNQKYFDQIIDAATLITCLCEVGPQTSDRSVRIIASAICDASKHLSELVNAMNSFVNELDQ